MGEPNKEKKLKPSERIGLRSPELAWPLVVVAMIDQGGDPKDLEGLTEDEKAEIQKPVAPFALGAAICEWLDGEAERRAAWEQRATERMDALDKLWREQEVGLRELKDDVEYHRRATPERA